MRIPFTNIEITVKSTKPKPKKKGYSRSDINVGDVFLSYEYTVDGIKYEPHQLSLSEILKMDLPYTQIPSMYLKVTNVFESGYSYVLYNASPDYYKGEMKSFSKGIYSFEQLYLLDSKYKLTAEEISNLELID
jgi:hypothetical protein